MYQLPVIKRKYLLQFTLFDGECWVPTKHGWGCVSWLDEATAIFANLFVITDHIVILRSTGIQDVSQQKVIGLYQIFPFNYQEHSLFCGALTMTGMTFVSKKIWEMLSQKEMTLFLAIFYWLTYQFLACLLVVLFGWFVFRASFGYVGDLISSLPAFGVVLFLVIVATGLLGFAMQKLELAYYIG